MFFTKVPIFCENIKITIYRPGPDPGLALTLEIYLFSTTTHFRSNRKNLFLQHLMHIYVCVLCQKELLSPLLRRQAAPFGYLPICLAYSPLSSDPEQIVNARDEAAGRFFPGKDYLAVRVLTHPIPPLA